MSRTANPPMLAAPTRQRANRRTAFVLFAVALAFFFAIMAKYWLWRHS